MTDSTEAFAAVRARAELATALPIHWDGEDSPPLPDTPSAFVFVDFETESATIVAFGGGAGANIHRVPAWAMLYLAVPRGEGLASRTVKAEAIAPFFRSYRDAYISCFTASVLTKAVPPQTTQSVSDNYDFAAVEVQLHYDQLG